MLVVGSILLKPVIDIDFEVDVVPKISRSCGCGEELCFFRDEMSAIHFNIRSSIVLGDETESCFVFYFNGRFT